MTDPAPKTKLSYIPSLDGMRSLLCVFVIITHWPLALPVLPFGWEGLQGFFVISGFLITRILVTQKAKHDRFRGYVRNFYIRRVLRIFPLYFLYLFAMLAIRFALSGNDFVDMYTKELAQDWMFYFTYTSNLKSLINLESIDTPFFMHLWSLGLEEQFYLLIPFLVFFLNMRQLRIAIVVLILLPFITRPLGYVVLGLIQDDLVWASVLSYRNLPFQCDSFALGAAVAVFNFNFIRNPKRWFYWSFGLYCLLIALLFPLFTDYVPYLMEHFGSTIDFEGFAWFAYLNSLGHPELLPMGKSYNYMLPLANLTCFFLVLASVRGDSVWKRVFEHPRVIWIGKLTYGIYIFHFGLIVIFFKVISVVMGKGMMQINPLLHIPLFLVYLLLLYYSAVFSYKYIEAPFLKLKRKFQ